MVEQVGSLVDEAAAVAVDGLDNALARLLRHLFANGFHPFDEEACGVGAFGHFGVAARHQLREFAGKALVGRRVEARGGGGVAGGAHGAGLNEERVGVAVGKHALHVEVVA